MLQMECRTFAPPRRAVAMLKLSLPIPEAVPPLRLLKLLQVTSSGTQRLLWFLVNPERLQITREEDLHKTLQVITIIKLQPSTRFTTLTQTALGTKRAASLVIGPTRWALPLMKLAVMLDSRQ